jgi:hypothetical protein
VGRSPESILFRRTDATDTVASLQTSTSHDLTDRPWLPATAVAPARPDRL